jgi:hypothetical protein
MYLIIGFIFLARPVISVLVYRSLDYTDVVWGLSGILLIWGIKFNGFYKIARLYAEWNLKRKDNKFRYYSK